MHRFVSDFPPKHRQADLQMMKRLPLHGHNTLLPHQNASSLYDPTITLSLTIVSLGVIDDLMPCDGFRG